MKGPLAVLSLCCLLVPELASAQDYGGDDDSTRSARDGTVQEGTVEEGLQEGTVQEGTVEHGAAGSGTQYDADDDESDGVVTGQDTGPVTVGNDNSYPGYSNPETIQKSLERRASAEKLRFCHDPNYVLHVRERPYCPLAEAAKPHCPEFATACARPEAQDRGELGVDGLGGHNGKKRGGDPKKEAEEKKEPEEVRLELPPVVAVIFRVLFWVVIAVLIGVIAYLLVSAFGRAAKDREDAKEDAPPDDSPSLEKAKPSVVESDVARLLKRAKQHRDQGRYGNAVDDLYAALLRYLEGEQLLVLEKHRTNGDYVRSLRQHPDWQRLVRDCGRDVERSQFGKSAPDAPTFDGLLRRIEPVVIRAVTILLLGIGLNAQFGCSAATGDGAKEPEKHHWGDLGDDAPDGLSVFVGMLEDHGYEVRQRIRNVRDLDEEVGMLVVYDDTSLEDQDWKALEEWVRKGHQLWIGGDRDAARHFGGEATGRACSGPIEFTANYTGPRVIWGADGSTHYPQVRSIASTLTSPDEWSPLVACESPLWSRYPIGSGAVTLFGDATVFTNASLVTDDNAVALLSMVQGFPLVVEFAGGLMGRGADSPYEALINAKLGPLFLQIAIFMFVWYLSRGLSFATLRDPKELGRRRFLDHLTALGRIFQRAHARQYALHHYSAWALAKLHDRVRPGQRMSIIELGTALAKRTGRPQAEVLETLADAATARNQPDAQVTKEELKVLRRLEAFVNETGGTK